MDDKNRHLSEDEILNITRKAMNKTFGMFGLEITQKIGKGGLGTVVEEYIFQYKANSDANPDFIDAQIELKVTPVKQNKDGTFSSKERLVLNMINYMEEADATFETSSFYHKNKRLLIWFYLYSKGKHPSEFLITNYTLFEFEHSLYYSIIKRDWKFIHSKIIKGEAHLISESDTTFLAACTKGANSSILTHQPFSSTLAKPRAYSFKSSFMTRMYREIIHAVSPYVSFISDEEWMNNPLEEVYKEKLSIYHGLTIRELKNKLHVSYEGKDITFKLVQRMLGLTGKQTQTQEMKDASIKLKTIRLTQSGTPKESMSFPAFEFEELMIKKWEESDLREMFVDWKFMFVIFKCNVIGEHYFDCIKFWNVPNSLVDGPIKDLYLRCVEIVSSGNIIKTIDSKGHFIDNFPKESKKSGGNGICHVRPHGRNANDTFNLPVADKLTGLTTYPKQCFWFNKMFIKSLLKKL